MKKKVVIQASNWGEVQTKVVEEQIRGRLQPKTDNHRRYVESMRTRTVTLCTGPAGTGKSTYACMVASQLLAKGEISKVVICRPMVTCGGGGKGMGFLPGDQNEKVTPYMQPLLDSFSQFIPHRELQDYIRKELIVLQPLELMRGASIGKSFIFLDEAQNAEFNQLHMFMTRLAEGSRVVVSGDATRTQTDLRQFGMNPFAEVIHRFERKGKNDYSVVRFTREDIVRHPFLQWIDEALTDELPPKENKKKEYTYTFNCPNCTKKVGCVDPDKKFHQVKCPSCGRNILLWDSGNLHPRLA